MKLTKLYSDQTVYVNWSRYIIDWDRKVSKPQKLVKDFLRPFWEKDIVYEEPYIPGSKKRLDLVNWTAKLIIEVSPSSTHTKYNSFLHSSHSSFLKVLITDQEKLSWAMVNGFEFLSLKDEDLKRLSIEMFKEKFGIFL